MIPMPDQNALVPISQREIDFYDDRVVAVLLPAADGAGPVSILVPIRPICDQLALSWSGQRERIRRDPVLSEAVRGVRVTRSPQEGGEQEMLCLPIEFLNGWLFGVSVTRVKPELQDKIIRYQRECYLALWEAFRPELLGLVAEGVDPSALTRDLYNIRMGVHGILDYLLRSQQHDTVTRRLIEMMRLDVHEVGGLIEEGDVLTERQRQTLYQLGLEVAALMAQLEPKHNPFAIVFGGIKKTFDVPTYRQLPRHQYRKAYEYLTFWKDDLIRQIRAAGQEPCIL